MLVAVGSDQWTSHLAKGNQVVMATDLATLNRAAQNAQDQAWALGSMAQWLSAGGYHTLATARNDANDAWLALCVTDRAPTTAETTAVRTVSEATPGHELQTSVGQGEGNAAADVVLVKTRLYDLGFGFFERGSRVDSGFVMAIRLFQSIIAGRNRVGNVDGRVDPGGFTWQCLNAESAPRWILLPLEGPGYTNYERTENDDHHDFGTSWLADTIAAAGQSYQKTYRVNNPGASLITVNDVSLRTGGFTKDHVGHETGLACDLRLPQIDGTTGGIGNPNTNRAYDRAAMRAQLQAITSQPLFYRAFFNDRTLVAEGLCEREPGHSDHAHVQIKSPFRG